MQVGQTDIIGGAYEDVRHMASDKPVVFHFINRHKAMYYKTFSLEAK
jgi:hypothetical protein